MARIVQFDRAGGPEVLQFREIETPVPGDDEVLIRVKAIGLNRAESMWRQDAYIEPVTFPARLGYEAAGIVERAGQIVTDFRVGDAVNVIPSFSMNQYGMYGDVVLAPSFAVVPHPPSLSFEEAASVWMMFVTAYGALIEDAKLTAEDAVIIPAASSSVALAAIQIGNMVGATTIALTRTGAKRQRLLDAGARYVIATEEQDLVAEVLKITGGKGARVVFDPVGGPTFAKLAATLSFQGILYIYGALSEQVTPLPVLDMIAKMLTVKGHNIWLTSGDTVRRKTAVEFILKGFASGALKPIVDRVFSFDEIVEAHRYLEANGQFGKIVATV